VRGGDTFRRPEFPKNKTGTRRTIPSLYRPPDFYVSQFHCGDLIDKSRSLLIREAPVHRLVQGRNDKSDAFEMVADQIV